MGDISAAVVFLVDECLSQQQRMAEGTRSKIEAIATSLNSVLRQMEDASPVDIALVGYRIAENGGLDVGSRWGGTLAGRLWVSSAELKNAPLRVENRLRQVPDPVMGVRQETVAFPVWYDPACSGAAAPRTPVYDYIADMLLGWSADRLPLMPPVVVSFLSDLTLDDPLGQCVVPLGRVSLPVGFPTLLQFHLGTNMYVPATKYPSMPQFLPPGAIQEMFHACSVLDESMIGVLQQAGEQVVSGAKGLVYNGRMVDLVRFVSLAKDYQSRYALQARQPHQIPHQEPKSALPQTQAAESLMEHVLTPVVSTPAATAPLSPASLSSPPLAPPPSPAPPSPAQLSPPPEQSLPENASAAPAGSSEEDVEGMSQAFPDEQAELPEDYDLHCVALADNQLPAEPDDLPPRNILMVLLVDRSVSDVTFRPAVEAWNRRLDKLHFMLGELARRGRGRYDVGLVFYGRDVDDSPCVEDEILGRKFLPDSVLGDAAGVVEEFRLQIPNGIGGLISLPRKKLCFEDTTPTLSADPLPGFLKVTDVVREWNDARPNKILQPMVLHITAGKFQLEQLDDAVRVMRQDDLPPIWLHHWVFTERPHIGLCCPGSLSAEEDDMITRLWQHSDFLPGREILAGIRPGIENDSRGMMVNMDFDILFEVIDTLSR